MMTCTYNFRWCHIYIKSPIMWGSYILDPQNPFFSFSHNFTNFFIFFKVRLISDSTRSDPSKEPIKIEYLCKNTKEIRISVTTGPNLTVRTSCHGKPYVFRIFTQLHTFYWLFGKIWPRWIRNRSYFWKKAFFGEVVTERPHRDI